MVDLFGCSSVLRNRSIRLYFLFLRPPKNFFSIFIFEAQAKQHLCWHSFTRVTVARCDFKACVCNLLSKHYVHILVIDVFYALSLTPHRRGTAVMLILVVVVFVKKWPYSGEWHLPCTRITCARCDFSASVFLSNKILVTDVFFALSLTQIRKARRDCHAWV